MGTYPLLYPLGEVLSAAFGVGLGAALILLVESWIDR